MLLSGLLVETEGLGRLRLWESSLPGHRLFRGPWGPRVNEGGGTKRLLEPTHSLSAPLQSP